MTIIAELNKRLDKKRSELAEINEQISALQAKARDTEIAINELETIYKIAQKKEGGESETSAEITLRRNGDPANAREALRRLAKPTYIDQILEAMGKAVTKENRVSLSGQLAFYVRKSQIFTRPEPNTFGLIEWATNVKKQELSGLKGGASGHKGSHHVDILPVTESEASH